MKYKKYITICFIGIGACIVGSRFLQHENSMLDSKNDLSTGNPQRASEVRPLSVAKSVSGRLIKRSFRKKPKKADADAEITTLAQLERNAKETSILANAEEALVESCMRDRGFEYIKSKFDEKIDEPGRSVPDLGDLQSAAQLGYGIELTLDIGEEPIEGANEQREYLASLSKERQEAYLEAFSGPSLPPSDPNAIGVSSYKHANGAEIFWYSESCVGIAQSQLYGEDVTHTEAGPLLSDLSEEIQQRVSASDAYQEALQTWRDCMAEKGWKEQAPRSAVSRLLQEYKENKISRSELAKLEIQIASADASCYNQAELVRIENEVRSRVESQVVGENRASLDTLRAEQGRTLERARAVVNLHG